MSGRSGGAVNATPQNAIVRRNQNLIPTDRLIFQPVVDNIYRCVQTLTADPWITGPSGVTSTTYAQFLMVMASWPGFSNLASCFDQYRVEAVELTFYPQANVATGSADLGLFCTVLDYDNNTALPSFTAGLQYPSAIAVEADCKVIRTFKPRIAQAAYGGVATTGYTNVQNQWVDCANPVYQYGVKSAWYSGSPPSSAFSYSLVARALMAFRQGQ
jgi:hypothetical protein